MNEPALRALCARIPALDPAVAARTQALLDGKTKPRRSLGRLEELACRVAAIRGEDAPALGDKAMVVMAADHGVAEEGVSAYPQEVTAQMLLNFARGGAAINVLARQAGARVVVVDMGVREPLAGAPPEIRARRVGPGTQNFTRGPAMSREQALEAIGAGAAIAEELAASGVGLVGIGEMGIGNTTSASALTALLTGAAPEEVTGRGTGIDDAGLRRKVDAIRRGLALHRPGGDALSALAQLGGFEIAGLAGVVLGAAAARVPVIADGFIAGVAALCAARIEPRAAACLLPSHRSVEVGHRLVLQALELRPLFDLELRLGEGTGAALAMGLVESSLRILHEMATFAAAGVSDTGR
ncbi:MAG TPA: nicotinate-nucleotide--dimethylbenzimidazole phosphoribosyltransferase [Polyangia bacterium]|nr:nicotinate-nucleotide--dimethylbenzimidazole phosphoribosyltransferase [Polyangia bacterium]